MGAGPGASTGGGGGGVGPAGLTGVRYDLTGKKEKIYGTAQDGKNVLKQGVVTSFQNKPYFTKQKGPYTLRPLEPLFDAGSKKTRTYFTNKVLKSSKAKKNIGYTEDEFLKLSTKKREKVYKGYLDNRLSGKTDAYGNVNPNFGKDKGNNNQNPTTPTTPSAPPQPGIFPGESNPNAPSIPLDPETSETDKKYDPRRTKKKGRNQNLLTSAKGVMKTSPDYSLGKKSLLGQVV